MSRLGSELLHCSTGNIQQLGKGFGEDVEGEERLFGMGEEGTALDLK